MGSHSSMSGLPTFLNLFCNMIPLESAFTRKINRLEDARDEPKLRIALSKEQAQENQEYIKNALLSVRAKKELRSTTVNSVGGFVNR